MVMPAILNGLIVAAIIYFVVKKVSANSNRRSDEMRAIYAKLCSLEEEVKELKEHINKEDVE